MSLEDLLEGLPGGSPLCEVLDFPHHLLLLARFEGIHRRCVAGFCCCTRLGAFDAERISS